MGPILAATRGTTSEGTYLVVLIVSGLLGYGFAVLTRRSIGTTPWRLSALTWGIVSALFPLFGLLLEMVARFTTRPAGAEGRFGSRLPAPPPPAHPVGWQAPPGFGPPPANPAGGDTPWPAHPGVVPGPGGWLPAAPGAAQGADGAPPPLFGWYPDPDAGHAERYWDGREWSSLVRDGEAISNEPVHQAPEPWSPPRPEQL